MYGGGGGYIQVVWFFIVRGEKEGGVGQGLCKEGFEKGVVIRILSE